QGDRRGTGDHRPLVARRQRRLQRRALSPEGRVDLAQAGAAGPADVDRRRVGSGDPAHGALRHGLAGRRRDPCRCRPGRVGDAGRVVAATKRAVKEAGRTIDNDHYGAGFPFYFGSAGEGAVAAAKEAYAKRTGRDPTHYFAIGDEQTVLERVAEYVAVGVEKFILRPV